MKKQTRTIKQIEESLRKKLAEEKKSDSKLSQMLSPTPAPASQNVEPSELAKTLGSFVPAVGTAQDIQDITKGDYSSIPYAVAGAVVPGVRPARKLLSKFDDLRSAASGAERKVGKKQKISIERAKELGIVKDLTPTELRNQRSGMKVWREPDPPEPPATYTDLLNQRSGMKVWSPADPPTPIDLLNQRSGIKVWRPGYDATVNAPNPVGAGPVVFVREPTRSGPTFDPSTPSRSSDVKATTPFQNKTQKTNEATFDREVKQVWTPPPNLKFQTPEAEANMQLLSPTFRANLERLLKDYGKPVLVTSSFRDDERQREIAAGRQPEIAKWKADRAEALKKWQEAGNDPKQFKYNVAKPNPAAAEAASHLGYGLDMSKPDLHKIHNFMKKQAAKGIDYNLETGLIWADKDDVHLQQKNWSDVMGAEAKELGWTPETRMIRQVPLTTVVKKKGEELIQKGKEAGQQIAQKGREIGAAARSEIESDLKRLANLAAARSSEEKAKQDNKKIEDWTDKVQSGKANLKDVPSDLRDKVSKQVDAANAKKAAAAPKDTDAPAKVDNKKSTGQPAVDAFKKSDAPATQPATRTEKLTVGNALNYPEVDYFGHIMPGLSGYKQYKLPDGTVITDKNTLTNIWQMQRAARASSEEKTADARDIGKGYAKAAQQGVEFDKLKAAEKAAADQAAAKAAEKAIKAAADQAARDTADARDIGKGYAKAAQQGIDFGNKSKTADTKPSTTPASLATVDKTAASKNKKSDQSWEEIYNLNKGVIGKNPNAIKTGQILTLPDGTSYTVKKGDTLSSIATKSSSAPAAIKAAEPVSVDTTPTLAPISTTVNKTIEPETPVTAPSKEEPGINPFGTEPIPTIPVEPSKPELEPIEVTGTKEIPNVVRDAGGKPITTGFGDPIATGTSDDIDIAAAKQELADLQKLSAIPPYKPEPDKPQSFMDRWNKFINAATDYKGVPREELGKIQVPESVNTELDDIIRLSGKQKN